MRLALAYDRTTGDGKRDDGDRRVLFEFFHTSRIITDGMEANLKQRPMIDRVKTKADNDGVNEGFTVSFGASIKDALTILMELTYAAEEFERNRDCTETLIHESITTNAGSDRPFTFGPVPEDKGQRKAAADLLACDPDEASLRYGPLKRHQVYFYAHDFSDERWPKGYFIKYSPEMKLEQTASRPTRPVVNRTFVGRRKQELEGARVEG